MRSRVTRVATFLFSTAAVAMVGCDQAQSKADREVRADLTDARNALIAGGEGSAATARAKFASAEGKSEASPALRAAAKSALAEANLDAATANIAKIDRLEMELSRHVWEITQLTLQVRTSNSAAVGYRQYDPKEARAAIAAKIAEAQGGNDKPAWFTHGSSTIPTLSAVRQDISRLEGEITQLQEQIKSVTEERSRVLADAEEAAAQADKLKGNEALEVFRKASELRKEAGSRTIELDKLQMNLSRLQRSLGIAQAQQATLNEVITQLQDQAASLEAAWKDVDKHIASHQAISRQIMGSAPAGETSADELATVGASILVKAAAMDRVVKEIQTLRDETEPLIRDAAKYFADAYSAADAARRELDAQITDPRNAQRPEKAAWESMKKTLAPLQFNLREAAAQRVLGGFFASKAASVGNRLTLRETMTLALQGTDLKVPPEVQDGDLVKEKQQALTEAEAAFKEAEEKLTNLIDVGSSDEQMVAQARLSRAITYYNLAMLERLLGPERAKQADDHIAAAKADRDLAAEHNLSIPAMPVELGVAPKRVVEQPAEPAPAEPAASPEEAAIREMLTAFTQAIKAGDTATAKSLLHFAPEQEPVIDQLMALVPELTKFEAAVAEKFPDQAAALGANVPGGVGSLDRIKIVVSGDEATLQGGVQKAIRSDGSWKLQLIPNPAMTPVMQLTFEKLSSALPNLTADVQSGKYESFQDLMKALAEAVGTPPTGPQ